MSESHCILLVQPKRTPASRTYSDYETVKEAMLGVVTMFQAHLEEKYPTRKHIDYDVSDLFQYLDSFSDIGCLVLQPGSLTYKPHDKEWIKAKVFLTLKEASE
eukprot:m.136655 g.136655  ORF g.136655 m.136655 type:complete len:103 (+) comp10802_c0_seq1:24-332(+)